MMLTLICNCLLDPALQGPMAFAKPSVFQVSQCSPLLCIHTQNLPTVSTVFENGISFQVWVAWAKCGEIFLTGWSGATCGLCFDIWALVIILFS